MLDPVTGLICYALTLTVLMVAVGPRFAFDNQEPSVGGKENAEAPKVAVRDHGISGAWGWGLYPSLHSPSTTVAVRYGDVALSLRMSFPFSLSCSTLASLFLDGYEIRNLLQEGVKGAG